jgi:hypothetical protein
MSNFSKRALFRMPHSMIKGSICSTCAVLLFAALVCAQESPDGRWEGSITENNGKIGITLDLAKNAESEWVASIGFAAENGMGAPSAKLIGRVFQNFIVNGASVRFIAVEMMLKFDLTLGAGGTMKGTITPRQGSPISVEFKRTGEAKIEDNPFVGTWKLNVGKSRPFLNPAKSDIATITIIDNGLKIVREELAADGETKHEEQVMIFDGKEYPSVPFPGAMQACSRLDDYGFICVLTIGGQEIRKIYDLISSDGRTGTVIYTFGNSPGMEGIQTFVYDKQ